MGRSEPVPGALDARQHVPRDEAAPDDVLGQGGDLEAIGPGRDQLREHRTCRPRRDVAVRQQHQRRLPPAVDRDDPAPEGGEGLRRPRPLQPDEDAMHGLSGREPSERSEGSLDVVGVRASGLHDARDLGRPEATRDGVGVDRVDQRIDLRVVPEEGLRGGTPQARPLPQQDRQLVTKLPLDRAELATTKVAQAVLQHQLVEPDTVELELLLQHISHLGRGAGDDGDAVARVGPERAHQRRGARDGLLEVRRLHRTSQQTPQRLEVRLQVGLVQVPSVHAHRTCRIISTMREPPPLAPPSGPLDSPSPNRRVKARTPEQTETLATRPLHDRYRKLAVIGRGGAGDVYRYLDRTLNRLIAIKELKAELARDPGMVRRFMHEAQVVAQLDHPAIIPVHDLGQDENGQWFLAMKEVHGRTLREIIAQLHAGRRGGNFTPTPDGWTFKRLVDAFRTVCDAVAFAHSRGVVHRDLKPDNVMVGDFGEVYVLDWGLARLLDDPEEAATAANPDPWSLQAVTGAPESQRSTQTRHGVVVGTPAYMPPEQARGDRDAIGPHSDVWALGALLYAVLYGRPPYRGPADKVLEMVQKAPPNPPSDRPAPEPLVEVWKTCMTMDPSRRYPDARSVAADVAAWLEGSRAREKALELVDEALAARPGLEEARERADRARERARAALVSLRASDPLEVKEPAWALEDAATRLQDQVEVVVLDIANLARLALAQVPDLPEARAILADLYRDRVEAAERVGDAKAARELRTLLAGYDDGRHADFLRAEGEVWLDTVPPGAKVRIHHYEPQARRLVARKFASTGPTPVRGVRMGVGSYLLELRAEGRTRVRYPVVVDRAEAWRPVPPGSRDQRPVRLPAKGVLHALERFIPAGWFISGGDPEALGTLPRQRLWLDDFSLAVRPVTHQDYLRFLDALLAANRVDEASARAARIEDRRSGVKETLHVQDGRRFRLSTDVTSVHLQLAAPVVGVSWYDAQAYCAWLGAQTGTPWRLPGEFEREKAARGVDARSYPWGAQADPAFHCMQDSPLAHPGAPSTADFTVDKSPYGVMGLAGGVQEWCADAWKPEGPERRGSRALAPASPTEGDLVPRRHDARRVVRGGGWNLESRVGRCASRSGSRPDRCAANLGFRICRSLELD